MDANTIDQMALSLEADDQAIRASRLLGWLLIYAVVVVVLAVVGVTMVVR